MNLRCIFILVFRICTGLRCFMFATAEFDHFKPLESLEYASQNLDFMLSNLRFPRGCELHRNRNRTIAMISQYTVPCCILFTRTRARAHAHTHTHTLLWCSWTHHISGRGGQYRDLCPALHDVGNLTLLSSHFVIKYRISHAP